VLLPQAGVDDVGEPDGVTVAGGFPTFSALAGGAASGEEFGEKGVGCGVVSGGGLGPAGRPCL